MVEDGTAPDQYHNIFINIKMVTGIIHVPVFLSSTVKAKNIYDLISQEMP